LISTCRSAKDAWDKLQTMFEGTSAVRIAKLQMSTTQFEELTMGEYETVAVFGNKLRDIANQTFQLE
jgi:hypothetical protein